MHINKTYIFVLAIIIVIVSAILVSLYENETGEYPYQIDTTVESKDSLEQKTPSPIKRFIDNVKDIPMNVKEQATKPIIDTLITKVMKIDDLGDAVVFYQKSKTLPIEIFDYQAENDSISFGFSLITNHCGNLKGNILLSGFPIRWSGKYGFAAYVKGNVTASTKGGDMERKTSSISELVKILPQDTTAISEDTPIQGALCLDKAGKFIYVKSDTMSTLTNMKIMLQSMNIDYAAFIIGHMFYNCSVGFKGITVTYLSQESGLNPDGFPKTLW